MCQRAMGGSAIMLTIYPRNPCLRWKHVILGALTALVVTSISFVDTLATAQCKTPSRPSGLTEVNDQSTFSGVCLSLDSGQPISDVELTLFEVTGPNRQIREVHRSTSDAQGRFSFDKLQPSLHSRVGYRGYVITAVAKGSPDVAFELRNGFDMNGFAMQLRMANGTGSIKGKVVDEQGNTISGAMIQRSLAVPAADVGLRTSKTNSEGLFILGGMPLIDGKPGASKNAYIQISHPDFPMQAFSRPSLDFSNFVLVQGCIVEGVVIDAAKEKPLAGIALSVLPADTKYACREHTVSTDSEGRFRFVLIEGNYNLILEDSKYVAKFNYLECRKGASIRLDPIHAILGGWIVGRVINEDTEKPVVMTATGQGKSERVGVGLFGPDRPMGKLIHTHWLDEVDNEGHYRILAHPGDNFPYLCNLSGSRNTWQTSNLPPVVVESGKETHYDFLYEPPRTPEQKMAKAKAVLDKLPADLDSRIAAILSEFRALNHTVDECEIWCLLLKELVRIGKPAVTQICKELESTNSSAMIRRLAFTLRAIGDPQAVPSLIRAIPKTLQPSSSDYGLIVEDAELMEFMQTHDLDERVSDHFGLRRPMREIYGTLNRLTKRNVDVRPLASISASADQRALARQEKIYYEAAREWADWWESHWQQFGVEQAYSKVNLPAFIERDTSGYPVGLELTENATIGSELSGLVLSPIGDTDKKANFLMDLDTGQYTDWPEALPADDDSAETIEATHGFAAARGFDLMCVAEKNSDGSAEYTLVGIDLELWEIDRHEANKIEDYIASGKLPEGRKLNGQRLLHRDPSSTDEASEVDSCFLYVTKDQGIGLIVLTDFVTAARDITGQPAVPKGVGFHRGVKIDYVQIAR